MSSINNDQLDGEEIVNDFVYENDFVSDTTSILVIALESIPFTYRKVKFLDMLLTFVDPGYIENLDRQTIVDFRAKLLKK